MGHYPECDSYECDECPRRDECVDYVPSGPDLVDDRSADAFLDYIEDRLAEIEERVAHLYRFEERILHVLAAVQKSTREEP